MEIFMSSRPDQMECCARAAALIGSLAAGQGRVRAFTLAICKKWSDSFPAWEGLRGAASDQPVHADLWTIKAAGLLTAVPLQASLWGTLHLRSRPPSQAGFIVPSFIRSTFTAVHELFSQSVIQLSLVLKGESAHFSMFSATVIITTLSAKALIKEKSSSELS